MALETHSLDSLGSFNDDEKLFLRLLALQRSRELISSVLNTNELSTKKDLEANRQISMARSLSKDANLDKMNRETLLCIAAKLGINETKFNRLYELVQNMDNMLIILDAKFQVKLS